MSTSYTSGSGDLREWWFQLTSPQLPEHPTFAQREAVRRGRLASITTLFISLYALIPIPDALIQKQYSFISILLITFAINIFALLTLNRRGKIEIAGWIVVAILDLGYASTFFVAGVNFTNLSGFELLVSALLVVVAFFPPKSVFLVMIANIAFTVLFILFGPHDPNISNFLSKSAYNVFYPPISLHVFAAVLIYLWVQSAVNTIADLDRSEEIVSLERKEISRQQNELELKQQLEAGIQQLMDTHTQAANGNLTVRAPLAQDNVLWQVAYSLNNLLARLEKYSHGQRELIRSQQAVHELSQQILDGRPISARTGTYVDELLMALASRAHNPKNAEKPLIIPSAMVDHAAPPSQMDQRQSWRDSSSMRRY